MTETPTATRSSLLRIASSPALSVGGIADVLRNVAFLKGVPPAKLEELASASFLRRYKEGDKVILSDVSVGEAERLRITDDQHVLKH